MGIAVIFGLGFATFLTLVLVPVFFMTWEELGGALKATFSFKSKKGGSKKKTDPDEATQTPYIHKD